MDSSSVPCSTPNRTVISIGYELALVDVYLQKQHYCIIFYVNVFQTSPQTFRDIDYVVHWRNPLKVISKMFSCLFQALEAEKCFESFPNTYITLQLAVYYYSLQIYTSVKPVIEDEPCTLYKHDPLKVIQKVINFVNNKKDYDWPVEVLELVTKLKQYYEALEDFSQAKMLQKLGRGISRCFKLGLLLEQHYTHNLCGTIISIIYGFISVHIFT